MANAARVYSINTKKELTTPKKTRYNKNTGMNEKYPFKTKEEIKLICNYFLEKEEYRNLMLFVLGINFPLRGSDLCQLQWGDIFTTTYDWRDNFCCVATKTGKPQWLRLNNNCRQVIKLYLEKTGIRRKDLKFEDYLFTQKGAQGGEHIQRVRIGRIIQNACKEVGLDPKKYCSHSLRKTWAYNYYKATNDLEMVQKILGHSCQADTLRYIGIQKENILDAYGVLDDVYGDDLF